LALASTNQLLLRVISALAMAPIALAAVWFGSPWLSVLVLVAVAAMGWEWARLCGRGRLGLTGFLMMGSGIGAVAAQSIGAGPIALAIAILGSAAVFIAAAVTREAEPVLAAAGTLWIVAASIAFLWLAIMPASGRGTALWLLAVVWGTDIAAYAAGRSIGGPRLAPRISPNKTWAGLLGGVATAGLIGLVAAQLMGSRPATLGLVSLALGVVAQIGDLAESLAKRHFGVKDSSQLIPGHGGVLDRLDGLLAAALAAGLLTLVAGDSLGTWR
jgi:phosphatidate cytidylyltransferase